jgi:uncharacterized small protein (DUF1192 family)
LRPRRSATAWPATTHDGLGHHLTVVQMQLQAARAVLSSETARTEALLAKAQRQAEEALYRTAQEGLTNVRKHAEATHAWLVLDYRDAAHHRHCAGPRADLAGGGPRVNDAAGPVRVLPRGLPRHALTPR